MADEFICDAPEVRNFIGKVKVILDGDGSAAEKLTTIRPHFSQMMAHSTWLLDEFRLLTNDVGCVLRHRYEPETGEVAPFRSGYTNMKCEPEIK